MRKLPARSRRFASSSWMIFVATRSISSAARPAVIPSTPESLKRLSMRSIVYWRGIMALRVRSWILLSITISSIAWAVSMCCEILDHQNVILFVSRITFPGHLSAFGASQVGEVSVAEAHCVRLSNTHLPQISRRRRQGIWPTGCEGYRLPQISRRRRQEIGPKGCEGYRLSQISRRRRQRIGPKGCEGYRLSQISRRRRQGIGPKGCEGSHLS